MQKEVLVGVIVGLANGLHLGLGVIGLVVGQEIMVGVITLFLKLEIKMKFIHKAILLQKNSKSWDRSLYWSYCWDANRTLSWPWFSVSWSQSC